MEYSQQQSTNGVTIVSDTHTTTSPVTTLSVVECLTTSSSVATSVSGQAISTVATTTGIYMCMHNTHACIHIHTYLCIYVIMFILSVWVFL